MSTAIPMHPDAREAQRQDPAAYHAVERLHEAADELSDAVDEQVNAIGLLFSVMHEPARSIFREKGTRVTQERLLEARQDVEKATARWTVAVSDAEALLRDRQKGGE